MNSTGCGQHSRAAGAESKTHEARTRNSECNVCRHAISSRRRGNRGDGRRILVHGQRRLLIRVDLKIERALSAWDLPAGGVATATIKIDTKIARAELIVKVPLAAGVSVDQAALETLVKKGEIEAFYQGQSLVLSLKAVPAGGKTITVPIIAARKGTFTLAAASAFVPRSAAEAWSADTRVVVH